MRENAKPGAGDGGVDLARFLDLPIYFFDLDPVLEHTGSLLARNRERLKAVCEHELQAISPDEVIIFAATGFYLIVHSRRDEAAFDLASRLNDALVRLFFGTDLGVPPDMKSLFRAVRPQASERAASRGDDIPREPAAMFDRTNSVIDALPHREPPMEPRDAYAELAIRGVLPGQNVELTFIPLNDLKRGRTTTFFCEPAFCVAGAPVIYGHKAFEGIGTAELPFIDRAILAHALKFARRLANDNVYTAIGAPVSFATLTSSRGREIYTEALRAAGVPDYPFLVLTVKDIPAGVTASRLAEIVGILRPLARRVFVHLPDMNVPILQCSYLGANGFVLSLPPRSAASTTERAANWLARVCEAQTALSCIDRIDNEGALEIVKRSAVRFGSGSAFGPTEFRGNVPSFEVDSFMKAAARLAQSENRRPPRFGRKDAPRGQILRLN